MSKLSKTLMMLTLLVVAISLFSSVPVSAQGEPVETVTIPLDAGEVIVTTTEIIVGLIAAASVGIGAGFGGLIIVVRQVRDNDVLKHNIERLYMSVPVETRERVRDVVDLVDETGDLLDELTDGKLIQLPDGQYLRMSMVQKTANPGKRLPEDAGSYVDQDSVPGKAEIGEHG